MNANKNYEKLLTFWIGPLVAGSCLAIGYEITHRLMILRGSWQPHKVEFLQSQRPSFQDSLDFSKQHYSNFITPGYCFADSQKPEQDIQAIEINLSQNQIIMKGTNAGDVFRALPTH